MLRPVETILSHWGHKPGSSIGFISVAALKKFGLLVDEGRGGNRQARLTDDAMAIILDERPDSTERDSLYRDLALRPQIHRDLWEQYGSQLPSDETLRFRLRHEKGFTERGVAEFIDEYKRTLAFAGLTESATLSDESADTESPIDQLVMTSDAPAPPTGRKPALGVTVRRNEGTRVFALPLPRRKEARLQVPSDLDESGWDQMMAVLNAMKPGILSDDEPENDERATD